MTVPTYSTKEGVPISLLRKALQRLQNSAPKLDFYKHTHGECSNFDNGKCKAAHFTNLNSKETACPHFKEKHEIANAR